ncbi:DNA polymerase III subunit chi [Pseudomonas syringae]|nr:DNA polymerase III subunit chi [Pseudomonas syringae]MBD8789634.1 DNA polymerase III subunit chi [Pseudomonas syringae]MBD8800823.1 DNA polymerase III subunit chi [Pseudomonas syringae]MBD8812204.1 DNA polymerase III subunit chi [Pseudomonas syringae]
MDTSKKAESVHLLNDLESIRKLLEDENLQPPLLTETVLSDMQIPMLSDMVERSPQPTATPAPAAPAAPPAPPSVAATPTPAPTPAKPAAPNVDTLLHLDTELRSAAQLIMQDVINDFAPHIETEIKRRLEARLERIIAASGNKL